MLMTIFGILILAMALFLVITILLQSSRDHRLSGTIAGGAETFFGKQKGKTMDGVLNKITAVVCVVFFVCVLLMYVFQDNGLSTGGNTDGNVIDINDLNDLIETGDIDTDADADSDADEDTDGEAEIDENTDDAEIEDESDVEAETEAETDGDTDVADQADAE